MLRFIKHHLSTEDGVAWYGMFSLMIFVLFFAFMLFRMWRMRKSHIEELSQLPFDLENDTESQNSSQTL